MQERILRRREVEEAIGLSKATIYRLIARGDFPAPLRIGRSAVGWRESELKNWLEGLTSH